jgi:GT2 family glycosyltransferase
VPEVSVVVASHGRADRLATCLDALAAQTLDRERWELVVVHTYDAEVAERVLDAHELARAGVLRHFTVSPDAARPSTQRNVGWREAHAPLIAFTDDDCRTTERWLEQMVGVASAYPGAIVQGATRPDPRDRQNLWKPHMRTVHVDPPGRFTQTCNILYERAMLERVGGFDEVAITGEDIDLARRSREAGAELIGAPHALVYHAVEVLSIAEKVRSNQKWEHLAYVVKKHPELRDWCDFRVWWKRDHLYAAVALAGLAGVRRRPWLVVAGLPYFLFQRERFPESRRGTLQAVRRIPELWLVDIAEIGTFLRGSVRYRTFLL